MVNNSRALRLQWTKAQKVSKFSWDGNSSTGYLMKDES